MTYVARPIRADGQDYRPASTERRYGRTLEALRRQMAPGTPYMVYREHAGCLEVLEADGTPVDRWTLPLSAAVYPVHYSPGNDPLTS